MIEIDAWAARRDVLLPTVVVLATALDRVVTVSHFHLESNAAVSTLGPARWIAVSVVLVIALVAVFYRTDFGPYDWIARSCLWFLGAVTWLAVVSNGIVVEGVA